MKQKNFYYGENNLATQLEKTDIEILEDKPCLDKFGNKVDASIHASRPNTICISAFRIAPKLVEEIANKEIIALLAHELSHFLGATEKKARELQEWVAISIRDVSFREALDFENTMWDFSTHVNIKLSMDNKIKENLNNGDLPALQKNFSELSSNLYQYDSLFHTKNLPLQVKDYKIRDFEDLILFKINLIKIFIDSLTGTEKEKSYSKQAYESCFSGKTTIKLSEISNDCEMHSLMDKNLYQDYEFNKLHTIGDIKNELKDVFQFLEDLKSRVHAIAFDQPLPVFHLPSNKKINPWEKFTGKYSANLIGCQSSQEETFLPKNLVALEVSYQPLNSNFDSDLALFMRESTSNGSSSFPIIDGDYNGSITLSGNETEAEITTERGNRWYDRQDHGYTKTSRQLITKPSGELTFNIKQNYFRYNWKGVEQSQSECQYSLKKEQK